MENEKRALSWREFVESGFDGREYQFPDFEGTFAATIACKRWDRNKNLLAYLDFDDGRKIMTSAWSEKNYLGLADIPLNTRVSVSFQFSAKGVSYDTGIAAEYGDQLLTLSTCEYTYPNGRFVVVAKKM